MDINDLTIGQARELAKLLGAGSGGIESGMINKFVIVRCSDAGVHAGVLVSYDGRSCVLEESRRLWYWKVANNGFNLSGVATEGLDDESKVGAPVRIHLTENCEIIECTEKAEQSIRKIKTYEVDS